MVIEQSTTDRNIFIPGWPWTPRVYETGLPVAANWWDPNNDIVCANIWAYRAINSVGTPWPGGPTVYADTLVNLVNPGVNDLVEGNGAVPWAQATGWGFVAAALQYFDTAIVPVLNPAVWTTLVQFSNHTTAAAATPIGEWDGGPNSFLTQIQLVAGQVVSYHCGAATNVPALATGNLAIAAKQPYRDGLPEAVVIPPGVGVCTIPIFIGALNILGAAGQFVTSNIESAWIADCTLADPQVLAVATAMSQL